MKNALSYAPLFLVVAACALFAACASSPSAGSGSKVVLPTSQDAFKLNATNRELGYQVIDNGAKVVFIFDGEANKIESASKVYVEGSFNGWLKGTDASWLLSKVDGKSVWTLTKDSSAIRVPGNSGFPEFKFYVIVSDPRFPREPNAISTISGYQMATNNLVLFPGDDPAYVAQNIVTASTLKKLSEFDLSDPAQVEIISNFRQVPGTTSLFRGYHPYKKSRPDYDTEDKRLELVNKQLESHKVQSIITLSGDEKPAGAEAISAYEQAIIAAGHQLFVNTSYNAVYYHSGEDDFGKLIGQIVKFINANPGPYYVHCRLGTDRTGTVSAVLAALSGALWADIAADYQKTNRMGIKEFRDYHLLQYSFEKMLGKKINDVKDLRSETSAYFVGKGYLAQADIDALAAKLTK